MLMRVYWANDARRAAFYLIVIMAVILAFTLLNLLIYDNSSDDLEPILIVIAMGFSMCYSASMIGSPLSSKSSSIGFLMEPASMLEKYAARCLYYIVGFWILFTACAMCIDGVRVAACSLIGKNYGTTIISAITELFNMDFPNFILLISLGAWTQSMFVLGGTVWPKRGFILTIAFMLVMNITISLLIALCSEFIDYYYYSYPIVKYFDDIISVFPESLLVAFAAFAGTVFNFIVAYFRIKEAEIVQRW